MMMTILIYGFTYVYLVTRIFGYNLSAIQTLLPVAFAFILILTAFKNKKTSIISIFVLLVSLVSSGILLYFTKQLESVMGYLWTLGEPYYASLSGGVTVELSQLQESVIVILVAFIYCKLLVVYRSEKYSYYVVTLIGISTMIIGFVSSRLSAESDRLGIVMFAIAQILYFFYHYYQYKIIDHESGDDYKFTPFFVVVAYYSLIGVILALFLFESNPYPFYRQVVSNQDFQYKSPEDRLREVYEYMVDQTGSIRDSFLFSGVTLMEVGGDEDIRYLKGLVYERFDGEWHQETIANPYEGISLDDYGEYSEVEIVHTRIRTPIIFAAGYELVDIDLGEDIDIIQQEDKKTYRIEDYNVDVSSKEISYTYKGLYLNKHSDAFKVLLSQVDSNFDLSDTVYQLPDEYDYIYELTDEIVSPEMTDYKKTEAIIAYLRNHYVYNVEPPKPINDNADRIEYFLFGSKEGFCQHFSTAAALMLRAENIPTRYVTGYLVDYDVDYSEIQYDKSLMEAVSNGRVTVKDSDAHTWIEVYFDGVGWIPFEATGLVVEEDIIYVPSEVDTTNMGSDAVKMDDHTKRILIIVGITVGGVVFLYGLTMIIRYIYRRKKSFRLGGPTCQLIVLNQLIHDYMKSVKVIRGQAETYREFAIRIDTYHLSEYQYAEIIGHYESVIYGDYEVKEDIRDQYILLLDDVRAFVRKNANIFNVIRLTLKEWTTR